MTCLMLQTFSKGVVHLNYFVNKAAYEAKCENKNKPELNCCGKCLLKKQLKATDNQDKSMKTILESPAEIIVTANKPNLILIYFWAATPVNYLCSRNDAISENCYAAIFRPPIILA